MVPRRILTVLVLALPVLLVAFVVVMGGWGLAQGMGEPAGATALRWIGIACLMLLVVDGVLLLMALGLNAIEASGGREPPVSLIAGRCRVRKPHLSTVAAPLPAPKQGADAPRTPRAAPRHCGATGV